MEQICAALKSDLNVWMIIAYYYTSDGCLYVIPLVELLLLYKNTATSL